MSINLIDDAWPGDAERSADLSLDDIRERYAGDLQDQIGKASVALLKAETALILDGDFLTRSESKAAQEAIDRAAERLSKLELKLQRVLDNEITVEVRH
ncbi:hypothetical protein [Leifsonia sp. Leaf264]|uniref:hypothetical protein n=1 Tax=Leifsonia sp. Leaf264 TaxID=1736314 RepID=UPI0006FE76BC|nr:hypothetical protein [Leifsonia sp. Leaf264]KQO98203.1 hypothetical protein ASF30_09080 [Leifsonia sp. Leaf264]